MKNNILKIVLVLCLLLSTLTPLSAKAIEGDGTEESPFLITNQEEFELVEDFPSSYFRLVNDIYMTTVRSVPLCMSENKFTGVIDGDGYAMYDLQVDTGTQNNYAALVGYNKGTIKNLTIVNPTLTTYGTSSGLVYINNGTISDCNVYGEIVGRAYAYGIAYSNLGTISGCTFDGTLSALSGVGGIAGSNSGTIEDCSVSGLLEHTGNPSYSESGEGVYGIAEFNGGIDNTQCIIRGCTVNATLSGYKGAGITNRNRGIIENCGFSGSADLEFYAGVAFYNNALNYSADPCAVISGCSVAGYFKPDDFGSTTAVGICYENCAKIENCYFTGTLYAHDVAGVALKNGANVDGKIFCGEISNCYVAASVCCDNSLGIIVSGNVDNSSVTNCFFDKDVTLVDSDTYGIAASETEMREKITFQDVWDFDNVWGIAKKINDGYPYLLWEYDYTPATLTGEGTEESPFLITNQEELELVSDFPSSHFKLLNDIEISGNLASLCYTSENSTFSGVFDGDGYCISNLSMDESDTDEYSVSLFYKNSGTIKNLNVKTEEMRALVVAGIAGTNSGIISDCSVSGNLDGGEFVSGIAGANSGTIERCQVYPYFDDRQAHMRVSGICDKNTGLISQCKVGNDLLANSHNSDLYKSEVAGICIENLSDVEDCYFIGSITGDVAAGIVSRNGYQYAGGIAGNVRRCYVVSTFNNATEAYPVARNMANSSSSIESCYYDRNVAGIPVNSLYGTPKTTGAMKMEQTYRNTWDLDTVWGINPEQNDGYPYLLWETGENRFETTGQCGDDVYWEFDGSSVLTIWGNGNMYDYEYVDDVPWSAMYRHLIDGIIIESGVTSIGKNAFADFGDINRIDIPDTMAYISEEAFSGVPNISEIRYEGSEFSWNIIEIAPVGNDALIYGTRECRRTSSTYEEEMVFLELLNANRVVAVRRTTVLQYGEYFGFDFTRYNTLEASSQLKVWQNFAQPVFDSVYHAKNVFEQTVANVQSSVSPPSSGGGGSGGGGGVNLNCGAEIIWAIENNTLTLTGTGEMYDYEDEIDTPWYDQRDCITAVSISDGITRIGKNAFREFDNITEISFPDSVESLGEACLWGCDILQDIVLGTGITSIENDVFMCCDQTQGVYISDLVAYINIERGNFDSGSIAANLYLNGELVRDLVIPNEITTLGNYVFAGYECIERVTLHNGITRIVENAFMSCPNIEYTLYDGSAEEWIAVIVEEGNGDLTRNLRFASEMGAKSGQCGDNIAWAFENGILTLTGSGDMYNYNDEATPWWEYTRDITEVSISDGITQIGAGAFRNMSLLAEIELPESIKVICESAFEGSSIEAIELPGALETIESAAFKDTNLASVEIPDGIEVIEAEVFRDCELLKTVELPESVKEIHAMAFENTGIEEITLPSMLEIIEDGVFRDSAITSIVIPESVTYMSDSVFHWCNNLVSVEIEANITEILHNTFAECINLVEVTLPEGLTRIVDNAFYNTALMEEAFATDSIFYIDNYLIKGKQDLTSAYIKEGTTLIAQDAFNGCDLLSDITIPDSVMYINTSAFDDTKYMHTMSNWENGMLYIGNCLIKADNIMGRVIVRNGTKVIAATAFRDCTNMTDLVIPDSVLTICEEAVQHCESLTNLTIGTGLIFAGSDAFSGSDHLQNVYIKDLSAFVNIKRVTGDSLRNGRNLYLNNELVTNLVIPEDITEIPEGAFREVKSIKIVTIHAGINKICERAFEGCEIEEAYFVGTEEQWNEVIVEDGCHELLSALVCTVVPRSEVTIDVQVVGGIYLVSPHNLQAGDYIVLACYKDEQMVSTTVYEYDESTPTYPFVISAAHDSVKIFAWENFIKPLCAPIER